MAKFWDTKFGKIVDDIGSTLVDLKVPIISSVADMAIGLLGSSLQKGIVNNRMSGAEREAFNLSAQEAQKARDWNLQMDNTKYQRQVTDMQNAGINPALAMSGGVSTQATSNATASASTQQAPMMSVVDLATTAAALKSAKADQDLKKAQADNYKEDERGKRIRNDADDVTYLDTRLEELREIRNRADLTEEEKRKVSKEIEVLEEERKIKVQVQTLNNDQHDIYELTKQKMNIELKFLPEQLRAALACDWAQAGYTNAQTDIKIAELESWDWNNRQVVTYSHARSVGAKIHFGLFKKFEAGGGSNVGLDESTQGLLVYDRKTKELHFIPTFGYFKDAEEDRKEDKKEGNKQEREEKKADRKENRAENKAERKERREPSKQGIVSGLKEGSFKLGGAK